MRKREYPGIDLFRMAAAVMVIAIHTAPLSVWNDTADFMITYCLGRVAVPFFFMVTGFFVLGPYLAEQAGKKRAAKSISAAGAKSSTRSSDICGRSGSSNIGSKSSTTRSSARLARFFRKNILIYLGVTLLYLPLAVYSGNLPHSIGEALKMLVFDGTFYHLWYFPAVLLGLALTAGISKLSVKAAAVLSVTAYVIGVSGDSWYGLAERIPFLDTVYQGIFEFTSYTRNGIFFAPLFLMLGAAVSRVRISRSACRLGCAVSVLILLLEGYFTYTSHIQRHNSMYFALPFVMFFLFRILLDVRGKSPGWVRDCSMLIYILHPAVIVAVRGAADVTHTTKWLVDNTLIEFAAVSLAAWILSYIIQKIWRGHTVRSRMARAGSGKGGR